MSEVISNCDQWKVNHVIIYQNSNTKIEKKWLKKFDVLAEFDWSKEISSFKKTMWTFNDAPKWFLLKRK